MQDLHLTNCIEARKWTEVLLSKKILLNDDIEFNVLTSCTTKTGTIKERLTGTISMNGFHGCNIELQSGIRYRLNEAPMGFRADYQKYEYDPIKEVLRISGIHPTFQDYTVEMYTG